MNIFAKLLLLAAITIAPVSAKVAKARLIIDDIDFEDVFLVAASDTKIRFQRTEFGASTEDMLREDVQTIFFFEPDLFTTAKRTYDLGNYEQALGEFRTCKKEFERLNNIPGNYSSLAGFYEMECLRRLGRYPELKDARLNFNPEGLRRQTMRDQIELYRMWEQLGDESWRALASSGSERIFVTRNPSHRVQVAYCTGVAQVNMLQPLLALDSFAVAMTADGGASADLARESAIQSLDIYLKDEVTTLAREQETSGSDDFNPAGVGALRLAQAGSIITVFENSFGIGHTLPERFEVFRRYAGGVE